MDSSRDLPRVMRLADYRPPEWRVPDVELLFALDPEATRVRARLTVERQGRHRAPLRLDGADLDLRALAIGGKPLPLPAPNPRGLVLPIAGDRAVVETEVELRPVANSRLMGLYASAGNLCTQCEAEGFRRITFFPDRPDVLSRYRVRLEADRTRFPVLLSNGNLVAEGALAGGRHFAEWDDPFPKPAYLFAVVAGRLAALEDRFVTASGRAVTLAIWAAPDDLPRCRHAMESLKRAMRWDEEAYGREYDLDRFNIVAVRDFNFGAMENKGLNIFNARYVLADPDTATDHDFDAIAAVVAHEYFHNWSGNRVTLRDWFQLSLKEGFTVFRDQQFTASLGSPAVRRIEGVRALRANQFPEDDGPLAHPVRPETYLEISNFYTATVYDKGAELIRMMAGTLSPEGFRRATDRYFERHDGMAATVEDFLAALAEEGLDAVRFRRWYEQPGTPRITADTRHDGASGTFEVRLHQANPRAGPEAPPLPVPMNLALFAADGRKLAERPDLLLTDAVTTLRFEGLPEAPILSLNRGFAAPVVAGPRPPREALAVLARHEDDPFARYEALQQLMLSALVASIASGHPDGHADVVAAVAAALDRWTDDPAFTGEAILVPSEGLIADQFERVNPAEVHAAREALRESLRAALKDRLAPLWPATETAGEDCSPRAKGLRRLRAILISLLAAGDDPDGVAAAFAQFEAARSMTDRMSALVALSHSRRPARDRALAAFHRRYHRIPECLDKWFLTQAASTRPDTRVVVERLASHAEFDPVNPNRLRALVLGFAMNPARFHDPEGQGYHLLARHVLDADRFNPQSAARLVQPLTRWRRLVPPYGSAMRDTLERVAAAPGLSKDVTEVVTTGLR